MIDRIDRIDTRLELAVTFQEPEALREQPVVKRLGELVDATQSAIEQFRSCF